MDPIDLPSGIRALGPDAVARLQTLVGQAEQRQADEAEAALQTALQLVPWPVRGIVRKVLLG
ncbi:hypothetical protein NBH00_11330 [Paraconexibacter antarcticus]|jgi:hypothetical protein|uniref:Uncharacterized protein n=1 Tax=Paraconexibacter antarcticus TaxID=2949664 RepID=A0ABY5E1S0_9ACTN|nr:hypothetical protein [Paraconexibacter antarcticus]UTI66774.1 hypothetical protein NBH00_11330 [Paraconexibacter antarcticus]